MDGLIPKFIGPACLSVLRSVIDDYRDCSSL